MIRQAEPWHAALSEIINGAHIASADDLVDVIDRAAARLYPSVRLYLVDLAPRCLNPGRATAGPALNIDTPLPAARSASSRSSRPRTSRPCCGCRCSTAPNV